MCTEVHTPDSCLLSLDDCLSDVSKLGYSWLCNMKKNEKPKTAAMVYRETVVSIVILVNGEMC